MERCGTCGAIGKKERGEARTIPGGYVIPTQDKVHCTNCVDSFPLVEREWDIVQRKIRDERIQTFYLFFMKELNLAPKPAMMSALEAIATQDLQRRGEWTK